MAGKSGNPSGRPKLPEELKDCTAGELKLLIWRLWKTKVAELKKMVAEDSEAGAGEQVVAQVFLKAIEYGDPQRLDYLLNRLIGKVKEVVEVEGSVKFELPTPQEAAKILAADWALLPAKEVKVEDL